jgi:hypothetical protein
VSCELPITGDHVAISWRCGLARSTTNKPSSTAEAFVTKAATAASRATDPAGYAKLVVEALLPDVLTYRLGSFASYGFAGRDGRALTDDAVDLQLTTITNTPVTEGLKPPTQLRTEFPFVGGPYTVDHDQTLFAATH